MRLLLTSENYLDSGPEDRDLSLFSLISRLSDRQGDLAFGP